MKKGMAVAVTLALASLVVLAAYALVSVGAVMAFDGKPVVWCND